MAFCTRLIACAALLAFSLVAHGGVFTEADTWYAKRGGENAEGDRQAISKARSLYLATLANVSGSEKIYAISQLGRLAVYEGEMLLPKNATAERIKIFKDCWDGWVEQIKDTNHPAYYYFKGVCIAYWGEAAGTLASLPKVPLLLDMIKKGQEVDTRFEGGGVYRLAAGVYSNRKARPLGLYKPEKALDFANKSLAQDAYPGEPIAGDEWYENFRAKGDSLHELGRTDEAIALIEGKVEELEDLIDEEELPEGRGPETLFNYGVMQRDLQEWQQ